VSWFSVDTGGKAAIQFSRNWIHRIPCECRKVYIGETGRSMQERIKEHDTDIRLARTQTSAVSEHANKAGHHPLWNEVKFIDQDSHWYARRVKEAIHIRLHPDNINRDNGIEIPEAWIPTIKKHNRRPVHVHLISEPPKKQLQIRPLGKQLHSGTMRIETHQ